MKSWTDLVSSCPWVTPETKKMKFYAPLIAKRLEEQLKNEKLERKITVDVEIEEAIKGIVL